MDQNTAGARLGLVAAIVIVLLGGLTAVGLRSISPGATYGEGRRPGQMAASLPYGKGMWIWQPDKTENGDVNSIVTRAMSVGLTHIYVRTGSSWDGFYAGPFLDQLLPVAHAAGIRVYGWDFPRLISVSDDVGRAIEAIHHRTPTGEAIDGFAADIETEAEGTHISPDAATAYGTALREADAGAVPLLAVVPRPSEFQAPFPYAELAAHFDGIAPMVYWLNREPGSDVAGALDTLRSLGRPLFPVGQAYDGGPEGGRPGVPPRAELLRFMDVANQNGAAGVSFWDWQEADQQAWDSIRDAPQFRIVAPLSPDEPSLAPFRVTADILQGRTSLLPLGRLRSPTG